MLIIGRLEDESIMLGDDIEIKIESIKSNKVYIAVKAPPEILIYRKENAELVNRQKSDISYQKGD